MVLKAGGGMVASMLTGFAVGAGTGAASGAAGSTIYQGITTGQVNKEQVKLAAISTGAGLAAAGAAAPALGAGNKAVSKVLGKALQRFGMGESAAAAAATVASMAGEGTLLGGVMAGTGDIAAQGYNIHAGNQTSINWKQTAKSTLVGGAAGFVTGGAIGMFSLTSAGQSFGKWMSEPTKLDLKAAEMVKSFWGDNRGSVSLGISGRNSGTNTTRVGRWMSQQEYDKMVASGKVQISGDNKVHVANPADINAFEKQAPKGSLYVEFDVPSNTISKGGTEGWGIINGPNSLLDRLNAKRGLPRIAEMPNATNITIEGIK